MIDLTKLAADAGPLWPTIEEAINDVYRAKAVELQDLHRAHEEATRTLEAESASKLTAASENLSETKVALTTAQKELAESRAFAESVLAQAGRVLADDKIDDAERVALLKALHDHASTPARERELAAMRAKQDELAAQIAAKEAELGAPQ